MRALMAIIVVPLIVLNFTSGIVGGVWLGILSQWLLIGAGVVYMIASPLALGLAIMPGMIFAAPAAALADRGNVILAAVLALPSLAWTYVVLGGSCVLVTHFTTTAWITGPVWPYLLWAYSAAIAPWAFMAQRDAQTGSDDAGVALFFAQLGTVAMLVATVVKDAPLDWMSLTMWCSPFMALGLLQQWITALLAMQAKKLSPLERLTRSLYE